MLKQFTLNRLLVLLMITGFGFLMIDTIIEHWKVFHEEWAAFIPVFFSAVALVLGVITFIRWNEKMIRILNWTLAVSVIVALLGIYFHFGDDEDEDTPRQATAQVTKEKEGEKPLLAPLSFAGVAIVGMLGTARKWSAEVVES